jgi:hypothetical protein
MSLKKRKLRPVIDSEWKLLAAAPEVDPLLDGVTETNQRYGGGPVRHPEKDAPVDHHFFRDPEGVWHLWACVRCTSVGRILYHWDSPDFERTPWRDTGEIIRRNADSGESVNPGDEFMQSPFFLEHEGVHYMFYGGGGVGRTEPGSGDAQIPRFQICLMTSSDGRHWVRHRNENGLSRLFEGPGLTRDPCVVRIDGLWCLYYCGESAETGWKSSTFLRTSKDLLNWSEPKLVHFDAEDRFATASAKKAIECPFVLFRDGFYYLFRTVDYYERETHVFRSEDPEDFGVGEAGGYHVCPFPSAAPELYEVAGVNYVSSSHNPPAGEFIARYRWVEE